MHELPTELISYVQGHSDACDATKHLSGIDALHKMHTNRRTVHDKEDAVNQRPQYQKGKRSRDRGPGRYTCFYLQKSR